MKKRGGRKVIITPNVLGIERHQDITLIKAVARAFRWRRMLKEGRFATLTELAEAEKINRSYLCRILRLTLLAPDIVEAIPDGRQPEGMTLPEPMQGVRVEWEVWREQLGGRPQSGARLAERDRYTDFSDRGAFASCSAELE